MTLTIVAVGKLQNDFLKLQATYVKRISFFTKVNIVEVKEVNVAAIQEQIKKETELIIKAIPKNSKVVLCSLQGQQYSSPEFAQKLNSEAQITFVIGGSHGVDEKLFQNKVCFSKMTFPHQLFRVFLLEQIFRGFSITKNMKYHK